MLVIQSFTSESRFKLVYKHLQMSILMKLCSTRIKTMYPYLNFCYSQKWILSWTIKTHITCMQTNIFFSQTFSYNAVKELCANSLLSIFWMHIVDCNKRIIVEFKTYTWSNIITDWKGIPEQILFEHLLAWRKMSEKTNFLPSLMTMTFSRYDALYFCKSCAHKIFLVRDR